MQRKLLTALGFLFLFIFLIPQVHASIQLVKTKNSPTVYYLNGEKSRHAFPNEITYKSWYGNDFSKVVIMSDEYIASIPLGRNITIKPGKYLVKVPSSPNVYAVEQGGVVRPIQDEGIAEEIYGKNWNKKVIDMPEVFFQNYIFGDPLQGAYSIPESIVYKMKSSEKWYWKIDDTITPFESRQAILDNGYTLSDVIENHRVYFERKRPIQGKSEKINNPLLPPRIQKLDCENKKIKMAFMLISDTADHYEETSIIEVVKKTFPDYYTWATRALSEVDTSYPPIVLKDTGYFKHKDNNFKINLLLDEVASAFYEEHPDIFDFLVVFGDFKVLTDEQAYFIPVTNRIEGIGKNMLEAESMYGSLGKLKGIIVMGNIRDYDLSQEKDKSHMQNLLLHEMLHQWSGSAYFLDKNLTLNDSLLKKPDLLHWDFYAGFLSPLGGAGWQDNNDGTFTSQTSQMIDSQKKPLAEIDLYLMGLLPYQVVKPVYYIVPDDPQRVGNTISAKAIPVTIEQIIAANGKWRCNL